MTDGKSKTAVAEWPPYPEKAILWRGGRGTPSAAHNSGSAPGPDNLSSSGLLPVSGFSILLENVAAAQAGYLTTLPLYPPPLVREGEEYKRRADRPSRTPDKNIRGFTSLYGVWGISYGISRL